MSTPDSRHGDIAVSADHELAVQEVIDPTQHVKAEGDKVKAEAVILLNTPEEAKPSTAGELREAGYVVPDGVADDEVPTTYAADRLAATEEERVTLVTVPVLESDLTPNEFAARQAAEAERIAAEEKTAGKTKAAKGQKAKDDETQSDEDEDPAAGK